MPYSDIYMLAHAKNRLNDICRVYGVLKDNGLKINMLLAGVAPEDRKYRDEIIYLESGRKISYEDNLQYVLHTRSILEVMQANGAGFTQRTCEAVCLGKKLLTNNTYIESAPFLIQHIYRPLPRLMILIWILLRRLRNLSMWIIIIKRKCRLSSCLIL